MNPVNPVTWDRTRFCEFETPSDAQIGPLEPKSRNLTKTRHVQKSFRTLFSEPKLPRNTALGTKYSSNYYLGPFLISSKTNFRIRRTSHSKTRLATHPRAPTTCIPLLFVITLRSKAALRSYEPRDVRQHPILRI